MKKGSENKQFRERQEILYKLICDYFPIRHLSKESWDQAKYAITQFMEMRRDYYARMEALPKRFGSKYSFEDYKKDVENVKLYYSRWSREDWFDSRKSLKRLRKYEEREGLEAFDVIEERERKRKEEEKLKRKDDLFALQDRITYRRMAY
jgi:hypothetical protein